MFCASLSAKSQGFWHISWHHGLLHDVLHAAVKIGAHTIATGVASVVLVQLRQFVSENDAIVLRVTVSRRVVACLDKVTKTTTQLCGCVGRTRMAYNSKCTCAPRLTFSYEWPEAWLSS